MDVIFKLVQTATFTFILSKENFLFVAVGEIPGDTTGVALQFCFFLNILVVLSLFFSCPFCRLDQAAQQLWRLPPAQFPMSLHPPAFALLL